MSSKANLPDEIREQVMDWFDEQMPSQEVRDRIKKMTNLTDEEVKRYVTGIKSQHTKGYRPRKSPEYTTGHVYFIRGVDSGRIKIGFSVDPENRLRSHQTGSSEKLSMIKYVEATQEVETEIKNRFLAYRVHGEWYEPADELLKYIEKL